MASKTHDLPVPKNDDCPALTGMSAMAGAERGMRAARIGPGDEILPRDMYRPLEWVDCGAIARMYNRNLDAPEPLWCAGGRHYDAAHVWLHSLVQVARGRGRGISQVHERDGEILSYFAAYARGQKATFTLGVVDLGLPDPRATWRQDTRHLFRAVLADGAEVLQVRASSDRAWFVAWMEDEVGMGRLGGQRLWTANRGGILRYVAPTSAPGDLAPHASDTVSQARSEPVLGPGAHASSRVQVTPGG
jgi:hypothetical protein